VVLSAHQPTFCPWEPFFEKIERSDVFVLLGHVQFAKNVYQNRFKVDGKWFTMSVNGGMEPLIDKRYVSHKKDWDKIVKRWPQLSKFDDCITGNLWVTNVAIIMRSIELLKMQNKVVLDDPTHLRGGERIIELCKIHGADTYYSGISGVAYLDIDMFESEGIKVEFQDLHRDRVRPLVKMI
jgi:hypothetical protein